MTAGERLPPPVHAELTDTIRDYWLARVAQHEFDWYAGVRLLKLPEDLRAYEHLLWISRAAGASRNRPSRAAPAEVKAGEIGITPRASLDRARPR
jgi:hypothetical protein